MSKQHTPILKNAFFVRRRGGRLRLCRAAGLLVPIGAVLVSVFASATSSAAPAPAMRPEAAGDAPAQTIVRNPAAKPTKTAGCPRGWGMSRLHAGTVWVGDSATGRIDVYRLDGTRVRTIETPLGGDRLAGFDVGPDGRLSLLDAYGGQASRSPGSA